jgi:hypothetical protein
MTFEKTRPVLLDKTTAFKIFHIVFSVVILIASLKTVFEAVGVSNWALFTLATAEAIAVVLFVVPKFTQPSGMVLMAIFLLAVVLSLVSGVIMSQLHLIVYFICTYFIVVLDRPEPAGEK